MKKNIVTDTFISTPRDANYGNLEELANNENPTAYVFREGELVPTDQVNTQTDNFITTSDDPNFSALDDLAQNENPTAYVFRDGQLVPESEVNQETDTFIRTSDDPNFGNLDDLANNENPTAYVFRDGQLVPESEVNQDTDTFIRTSDDPNFAYPWYKDTGLKDFETCQMARALEGLCGKITFASTDVKDIVLKAIEDGFMKKIRDQAESRSINLNESELKKICQQAVKEREDKIAWRMPKRKEDKEIFGGNDWWCIFYTDSASGKRAATLDFKIAYEPGQPKVNYRFHVLYENDHPGRGTDCKFGGTIKIFPVTRDGVPFDFKYKGKQFEHLIRHNNYGIPYICQLRVTDSAKVNSFHAIQNLNRWMTGYEVFHKTGKDIDAGKAA